jgi:TetR/AcrR family fatty acid metabolism transcriptional regulator
MIQDKREQQRAARRKQILEAALRVFMEKGFHVTNVSDVAAEAGVSQGTIYWYFESKDELFNATVLEYFAELGQETRSVLAESASASEKLRVLGEAMGSFAADASRLLVMFLGYMAALPDRAQAASSWLDLLLEYKEALVGIIEEGQRSGEFRDVDAESLVWAVMCAYDGLALYLSLMPDIDTAKVSRTLVDTLIAGLEQ